MAYRILSGASDDSANVKLLEAAKKATRESSGYHVEVSATYDNNKITFSGNIAGDDFDLTLAGSSPIRVRSVRDKYWSSSDNGSSWSPTERDRGVYNLAIAAVSGYVPSNCRVEVVRRESIPAGSLIWLEVKPDPPPSGLNPNLPRFGIVQSGDGSTFLQRYKGAVGFMGAPIFAEVTYSSIGVIGRIIAP
jgi:hypothetical protein